VQKYKDDLAFFIRLRSAVIQRYSDAVDFKQYEGQIQKLIDTHVHIDGVEVITSLVNIFDKEKFQQEVEKTVGEAAKADKIASRTAKHISVKMDEDPAFYKKFSVMLKETIQAYLDQRLTESQYLAKAKEISEQVLSRTDSDIPESLLGREAARAFFGMAKETLSGKLSEKGALENVCLEIALAADAILLKLVKVDWQSPTNLDIHKKMIHQIGDYLIDEVRDKYSIPLGFDLIDELAAKIVDVAKLKYKQ
jgi:type I restriction enzyme, R subunit